jgi:hypothetical protein
VFFWHVSYCYFEWRGWRSGDFLPGKVMVAGGDLPWDPVPITVTCDGKIRFTANAEVSSATGWHRIE